MADETNRGVRIVTAQPGAGKTEYVLQQLCHALDGPGWSQVWLLLPDELQKAAFRRRLLAREGRRVACFNLRLFRLDELTRHLLHLAGRPPRRLSAAERQGLLRNALDGLAREGALPVFGEIAGAPGLLRAIGNFLEELQQQQIAPDALAAAAHSAREGELARVAGRYQSLLRQSGGQDRGETARLAREALTEDALRSELARVDLLLVDGFERFTPLQAATLMPLAGYVRRALITLPEAPGREGSPGAAFRQTLESLRKQAPPSLRVESLPAGPSAQRHGLQQLIARIFRHDAQPLPKLPGLRLLEAPGPRQEALAITRRIRQLLLESDARPEDCLIALRDWKRYAGPLRAAAREHGIPLAFTRGESLAGVPSIRYLLKLLQLAEADFPRQELLDVLRAPCHAVPGLAAAQVAQLERISLKRRLRGGREDWLTALRESDSADGEALAQALRDFMDAVTPPAGSEPAALARWLHALCGAGAEPEPEVYTLNMRDCLPAEDSGEIRERETAALQALDALLCRMAQAGGMPQPPGAGALDGFAIFRRELGDKLDATWLAGCPPRDGAVTVVEAGRARGLSQRHVFLPGLSVGIFPQPQPENPLLLRSERAALKVGSEEPAARAPGDDALFYQLLGLARETLMVTRPTVEKGAPLEASHLWHALRKVCPQQPVQRIRAGALPHARGVASREEALVVLAANPQAAENAPLQRWLQREHRALREQVEHARRVEAGRFSRCHAHDRHSGVLAQQELIARVAAELGPEKVWSATRLGALGACRYRYFAGYLLDLEELPQAQPGLDAREEGTLNHEILERVYGALEKRGLEIGPESLDAALQELESAAQRVFEDAPQLLKRPADALWPRQQQMLRTRLEGWLRLDFSDDSPLAKRLKGSGRRVRWQELRFGYDEDDFRIPLRIDGRPEDLRLRGKIDRIDEAEGRLLVIDYKRGSASFSPKDLREGVNVQMWVYLRAAKQLPALREAGAELAGGVFLYLNGLESSRVVQLDGKDEELMRSAEMRIAGNIAAARRGDFRVEPRSPDDKGRCGSHCAFSQLCRVAVTRSAAQGSAS